MQPEDGSINIWLAGEFDPSGRNDRAPLPIVAAHVRALRAVIEHWRAFQCQLDEAISAAWTENGFNEPRSLAMAWGWWADHLNAALSPFTVRIDVDIDDVPIGFHRPPVTAYSAMALQVRNDVAQDTPWRLCANEPCDFLFARQVGRGVAAQYREKGVKYCSKNCAKAQVERERRRRRKAEANG
jgi:hypothetical protein